MGGVWLRLDWFHAGKYRTAVVTDEGDVYMWEGWSKPAELSSSRGATGERVSQAMGRPEQGATPGAIGGGNKRPPRLPPSAAPEEVVQDAAAARRGRKSERARALVQQRILPVRCSLPLHQDTGCDMPCTSQHTNTAHVTLGLTLLAYQGRSMVCDIGTGVLLRGVLRCLECLQGGGGEEGDARGGG